MKAKTNRRASKIVIAIALVLVLLTLLSTMSYAWIRNYVSVDKIEMSTGKMLYKILLVKDNGEGLVATTLFDTGTENPKKQESVEAVDATIDVDPGEEVFFVVQKYGGSIDIDSSISFEKDIDAVANDYEYLGQTWFEMKDVSSSLNLSETSNEAKIISEINGKALGTPVDTKYEKNTNLIWDTVQRTVSLDEDCSVAVVRFKFYEKEGSMSVDATDKTFPLRVKFCVAQKGSFEGGGKTWNISSIDALKQFMNEYNMNDELYLSLDDPEEEEDIVWNGDLVFTRPCKITLNRTTLRINGNLIFSYAYDGTYILDTVSGGQIRVMKNVIAEAESGGESVEAAGGSFKIDLPNAKVELKGANNEVSGKADVYVEGTFEIAASKNDNKGAAFNGLRVCEINGSQTPAVLSKNLKPLIITGDTRLTTTNLTNLGKITAKAAEEGQEFSLKIVNRGVIEQIDLTDMAQDDTETCIVIDNGGTIGKFVGAQIEGDTDTIRLPDWAVSTNYGSGNTRIIANKGSNDIKAISEDSIVAGEIKWPTSAANQPNFISNLTLGIDGLRDDIDRGDGRDVFIEVNERDDENVPIDIIIHYETPTASVIAANPDLADLVSLRDYVEYYKDNVDDSFDIDRLLRVKIVCYGNKVLCGDPYGVIDSKTNTWGYLEDNYTDAEDDYAFIREMVALEELDLSDAISATKTVEIYDENHLVQGQPLVEEHKTVPAGAFAGMINLSSVTMSERDTMWEPNLFNGTKVDEITFPQALLRLLNTRNSITASSNKGMVKDQDVLNNIKYVYTSITKIEGLWINDLIVQYFFTPDEVTYNYYREELRNTNAWQSKIFMNNGVVRYGEAGEIFLRYDPDADQDHQYCEFVVNTNSSSAWLSDANSKYGFDFQKINIGGKEYKIVSYDPYALYNKLSKETSLIDITFGENLESIGEYAFAANSKIKTVTFDESTDTALLGYTFYNNAALTSVNALAITTLEGGYNFANDSAMTTLYMPKLSVVTSGSDLYGCKMLRKVDIGVIEYTTDNSTFYSALTTSEYDKFEYARFYIHTEGLERENITFSKALAADYRYIFVNSEFANLYTETSTYTGVAPIGNNQVTAIPSVTIDGIDYYYYENGAELCLVACLSDSIDKSAEDKYTLVGTIGAKNITKIGSAAYHFTKLRAKVLNIPESVTEIGRYAFSAQKTKFKKECGTIDLKNVTKADTGAFYYAGMVKVVGNLLTKVGAYTFSNNENLAVAKLPLLIDSQDKNSSGNVVVSTVFEHCKNLRIAYTGISSYVKYDGSDTAKTSYIRFINGDNNDLNNITIPNINTVINSSSISVHSSFSRNYVKAGSGYEGIYLSDYYDYSVKLKSDGSVGVDMDIILSLPSYVFYEDVVNNPGEVTLIAVSPDLVTNEEYTTPTYLDVVDDDIECRDNIIKYTKAEGEVLLSVKTIGKYAYSIVPLNEKIKSLVIAPEVFAIQDGAFYSSSGNIVILGSNVKDVNLTNVQTVGASALRNSKFEKLTANKVTTIGDYAFYGCTALQKVSLPEFKEAVGSNTFAGCTNLVEITFGKHAEVFVEKMFENIKPTEKKPLKITILNEATPVEISSTLNPKSLISASYSSYVPYVSVYVHGNVLSQYQSQYSTSNGFGKIPLANFDVYGEATEMKDGSGNLIATYYWEPVGTDGAYINHIELVENVETFDFDDTLGGKTVVSVSASAISALSGVKQIILPSGMKYLTFTAAALSDSVEALVIGNEANNYNNGFFKTVNGVLYSADGSILYAYPKAKTNETFNIAAGSGVVNQIFAEAFSGASKLKTLNITGGALTINDRAFEKVVILDKISFASDTPSVFAGWDILDAANVNLKFYVPSAKLAEYKANVKIDYSILDRFIGQ